MAAIANVWKEAMRRKKQHDRGPALDRVTRNPGPKDPDAHAEENDKRNDAHQGDHADRPHRQGCDAVDRERDHFCQRVFCFAVQPRQSVICDRRRREPELYREPAQEYVRLRRKAKARAAPGHSSGGNRHGAE